MWEVGVSANSRKSFPINFSKKKTNTFRKSFALASCFATFRSRPGVSVFPLLEVIHVGRGTRHLLIQLPESCRAWTPTRVGRPPGKHLEGFRVTGRAGLLPVCAQVLGSLLGRVPEVRDGRPVADAWLDLLPRAGEEREGGRLGEGVAWRGETEPIKAGKVR